MAEYTPILHLPQVAPNQDQKETTINTALAILEAASNDTLEVSLTAGDVTLNTDEYTKYFHHQFYGHTSLRTVTLPATKRWFSVENQGTATITFQILGSSGLSAELASGKIGLVVSDGTDLRFVVPDPTSGLGLLTDLSDVDGGQTDGQLLRWSNAFSAWKPWTLDFSFLNLNDTPTTYVGNVGKLVAVKGDGTGLEFVSSAANVNSFVDLDDTPGSYSGAPNRTVKVNGAASALVFDWPKLTEASDFVSSYAGAANKFLRVKTDMTGVELHAPVVADLTDGPGAPTGNALKYLRVKADGTGVEYATGTGGPDDFLELLDTPDSYAGKGLYFVRVKADLTGLDFLRASFTDLIDVPSSYTGQGGKYVKVNGGGTGLSFSAPTVQELANGPGTPAAQNGKVVRVKLDGTALEYAILPITTLSGFPSSFNGQGGKYLQVKGDETGVQFVTSSYTTNFLALTDTPDSYAGQAGKAIVVDPTGSGLIFASPSGGASKLDDLDDVEFPTGTPADGMVLTFRGGMWSPEVSAGGSDGTLASLTDVDLTSPTDGQTLVYRGGDWVNEDTAGMGVPSFGEHTYWRLLLHTTDGSTAQYGIQEIQFKHTKTGPDMANGGTASASSDEFGTVSGAFDNVISGAWFSATAANGEWIKYQFTTPVDVRYMTIQGSQSQPNTSPASFSVQFSDDDSAWTTAWEVTGQTGWAPGQTREFHAPVDFNFTDLADVPQSYIGQGLKALRVNTAGTALEFFTLPFVPTQIGDLADVEMGTGTPAEGSVLTWKDGVWQAEPSSGGSGGGASSFLGLNDTPNSYEGQGGNAVRVKVNESGLEFYTPTGGGGGGSYRGIWASGGEQVIIDFEDSDLGDELTYDASGYTVVSQPDGTAGTTKALKFRPIPGSGLCYAELSAAFLNVQPVKVRYKVSSEGGFDFFRIILDGTTQILIDSGATGLYEEFTYPLVGNHTLRFQYSKDGGGTAGDDTVYISQITYYTTQSNPYLYGDTVSYQDRMWFCRVPNTTQEPGAGDEWIEWKEALSDLSDVDLTSTPADGQALVYDVVSGKFKPGTVSGGGGGGSYNAGIGPRTRVRRAATQSVATATWTAVQWDTESEDAVGAFASGASTRITVPAGVSAARATGYVNWNASVSAALIGAALRRNGVEIGSTGGSSIVASREGLNQSPLNFTTEWFPVTAGDYYELFVLQNSGANANLNGPVTAFGEGTYLQFEWDDGTSPGDAEAGDFHAPHQGWRILVTASQTDTYATISELKFYNRSGTQIATTGGKVVDTNSHATYPASQAFDGNTSTYWSSIQQTSTGLFGGPGYLFATAVDVGSIKITSTGTDFNTTNSPKTFVVQYTDDGGASWTTYATYSGQTAWGDKEERTFVLPLAGVARVGGARTLDELQDVAIVGTPKHGDILRYDGASQTWNRKTPWGYAPPKAADFPTLLGTVSLTLADDDDVGLMVDCGQSTFGDIQRIAVKALPGGGVDWTVTAKIVDHLLPYNYNGVGLIMRESSTGKIAMFGVENTTNVSTSQSLRKLRYSRLPGLSGFTSNPYSDFSPSGAQWYRLKNTGGLLTAWVSTDGKMWRQIYLESSGGSFTSGPDQIGIGCSLNASYSLNPTFSVPYWAQSF
ncbi:tail protein [Caulobacter phage CcrBL9]|uniref:Putative tail protein n=1 Tax=Caulobacter phage CcrBL9 TaxID=2283270 RepID=A0A385EEE9_9CAUD|nr:tail protein [Caulobacter phage CcrBL9]AXQ69197.1 putative tail protein [Caulobacter phage CcrBL9]